MYLFYNVSAFISFWLSVGFQILRSAQVLDRYQTASCQPCLSINESKSVTITNILYYSALRRLTAENYGFMWFEKVDVVTKRLDSRLYVRPSETGTGRHLQSYSHIQINDACNLIMLHLGERI